MLSGFSDILKKGSECTRNLILRAHCLTYYINIFSLMSCALSSKIFPSVRVNIVFKDYVSCICSLQWNWYTNNQNFIWQQSRQTIQGTWCFWKFQFV